jgi:hypothetical protein
MTRYGRGDTVWKDSHAHPISMLGTMKTLGKVVWSAAVWCALISVVLHAAGADSLGVSLFAAVVGGLVSLEELPVDLRF